jgi:trimethylamine--corrinoid protein Co-methyltransferase
MSMALPEDVPPGRLYATVFAEVVKSTSKPVVATSTSLRDLEQIRQVASLVAGGEEELCAKPFYLAYLEPISPLRFDRSVVERLLHCAEHRVPVVFAAGANCGSGAPITPEGGVVQGSAESLAGLVLMLLKNPQAVFVYGANTSVMDMATSIVSYGAPEWFRTVAMYADMGKYYDLPSWGTAGCSDSFRIDAQAAMESYEGILMALLSSTTMAHDVGYLAHGSLYDARLLVLADEMIKRGRHLLKGADLSRESLSVEVIDEVARKNELYLAHPRTAEVFRETLWLPPSYFNRRSVVEEEGQEMSELLEQRLTALLASHEPQSLPPECIAEIDEYLASLPE